MALVTIITRSIVPFCVSFISFYRIKDFNMYMIYCRFSITLEIFDQKVDSIVISDITGFLQLLFHTLFWPLVCTSCSSDNVGKFYHLLIFEYCIVYIFVLLYLFI